MVDLRNKNRYNHNGDYMDTNLKDLLIKEGIKINLKRYRQANALTQTDLCEVLKIDRTTYTKWESGDTLPNLIQLSKIARIYGINVDDLMGKNDTFAASNGNGLIGGEKYFIELSDEERKLILNYRVLNYDDRLKASTCIKELSNTKE